MIMITPRGYVFIIFLEKIDKNSDAILTSVIHPHRRGSKQIIANLFSLLHLHLHIFLLLLFFISSPSI